MDELADYPLTQALLRQLLRLDPADEVLPLRVLVNLHRGVLRKPLQHMDEFAWKYYGWNLEFEKRYQLEELEAALGGSGAVRQALAEAGEYSWNIPSAAPQRLSAESVQLIKASNEGWTSWDPVVVLHALTWSSVLPLRMGALLNAQLAAHPGVAPMLLDLAR